MKKIKINKIMDLKPLDRHYRIPYGFYSVEYFKDDEEYETYIIHFNETINRILNLI